MPIRQVHRLDALLGLWLWATAAVAAASCGHGAPDELAVEKGGRCGGPDAYCLGWNQLLICEERQWTLVDCPAECAALGSIAVGCVDTDSEDACLCDNTTSACGGATPACVAADELRSCLDGEWEYKSCTDVCKAGDPALPSAGCFPSPILGDACACTREGTPCLDGTLAVCDGPRSVASCVAGAWVVDPCLDPCDEGVSLCVPWEDGEEAACSCVSFG